MSSAQNLFAGSVAGISATVVCHPLDVIRTRLQTSGRFRGAIHCASLTVKEEGFRALYKGSKIHSDRHGLAAPVLCWSGMASPLAAQGVYKAVMFASYGEVPLSVQFTFLAAKPRHTKCSQQHARILFRCSPTHGQRSPAWAVDDPRVVRLRCICRWN
jgi:hypothetical protein